MRSEEFKIIALSEQEASYLRLRAMVNRAIAWADEFGVGPSPEGMIFGHPAVEVEVSEHPDVSEIKFGVE